MPSKGGDEGRAGERLASIQVPTPISIVPSYQERLNLPGDRSKQFLGFVVTATLGGAIQLGVASAVRLAYPSLPPQVAVPIGVVAGFFFNFTANRYFVFRKRHPVRVEPKR